MSERECRVAVVVGGSRGIGAATARLMAGQGVSMVVAAPPSEDLEPALRSIRSAGARGVGVHCDATRPDDVARVVEMALGQFERIDAWVNCVGVMGPVARIEQCDPAAWAQCVNVNLIGVFNGCRAVLPHFRARGDGVIVNMSTKAAFHALEGWSAYCSSKAGLAMLSHIIAAELADTSVRCYSLQPGMVNTDLGRESMARDVNRVTKLDPSTFALPEEPARAIAWLCRIAPAELSGVEVDITDAGIRTRMGLT